jgi:FO synthase
MPYRDYILGLKQAGLGSMPGTAAEILDVAIRKQLTRDKLSSEDWVAIVRAAHSVGMRTTATIMYGHIDRPRHWAAHLGLLRGIQKETGGFTELVPLGFVHHDSPLYARRSDVRPGPSDDENLKMHAVARVMLHGVIDNIQVSWVKLGHEMAVRMLRCGANDLGGTLMNESISRAAGAKYGQEVTPKEMVDLIRAAGQTPFQRNTLYEELEVFEDHDPVEMAPLVKREGRMPTDFLNRA